MPHITILFALIATGSFATVFAQSAVNESLALHDDVTLKRYRNEWFSISYPSSWRQEGEGGIVQFLNPANHSNQLASIGVFFGDKPELQNASLEAGSEIVAQMVCAGSAKIDRVARENAGVATDVFGLSNPALVTTLLCTDSASGQRLFVKVLYAKIGSSFASVLLTVPSQFQDSYKKLFQKLNFTTTLKAALDTKAALNTDSSCPSAATIRFTSDVLSFCHPPGWGIQQKSGPDPSQRVFTISPTGGFLIMVRYLRKEGEVLYWETHKDDLRVFDRNTNHAFTKVGEQNDPGHSVTTHLRKRTGSPLISSIVTTVYEAPHLALVSIEYATGDPDAERLYSALLDSLVLGKPSLVGVWRGDGTEYTFSEDGTVTMREIGRNPYSRGTYSVSGSTVQFRWNSLLGTSSSSVQRGQYRLTKGKLVLAIEGGPEGTYRKSASR